MKNKESNAAKPTRNEGPNGRMPPVRRRARTGFLTEEVLFMDFLLSERSWEGRIYEAKGCKETPAGLELLAFSTDFLGGLYCGDSLGVSMRVGEDGTGWYGR